MNDFEKMNYMSKNNKDIRMFPMSNIKRFQTGKNGYGEVVIAVNNETIIQMTQANKFVGGLYLMDSEQWEQIKASHAEE